MTDDTQLSRMDTARYDTYHAWDSIYQVGSPVVCATTRYTTTIRAYTAYIDTHTEGACVATLLDNCHTPTHRGGRSNM